MVHASGNIAALVILAHVLQWRTGHTRARKHAQANQAGVRCSGHVRDAATLYGMRKVSGAAEHCHAKVGMGGWSVHARINIPALGAPFSNRALGGLEECRGGLRGRAPALGGRLGVRHVELEVLDEVNSVRTGHVLGHVASQSGGEQGGEGHQPDAAACRSSSHPAVPCRTWRRPPERRDRARS